MLKQETMREASLSRQIDDQDLVDAARAVRRRRHQMGMRQKEYQNGGAWARGGPWRVVVVQEEEVSAIVMAARVSVSILGG